MYKKLLHVQSCFFAKGLFTRREEDSSARKILEGVATLRWVYMQRFRSVWCPNIECLEKELNGGRQKQICSLGPSAVFTGINNYLSAELVQLIA